MFDISSKIKNGGIALERQALDKFGAAVNMTSPGDLSRNLPPAGLSEFDGSFGGNDGGPDVGGHGVWDTTPYAAALVKADQVKFNPKLKFLFKVSFTFNPDIFDAARMLSSSELKMLGEDFSFLIRHVDRPKFDFDYEEVNMYNFRTKILKSIKHREVTFTAYDDIGNTALTLVNVYRKLLQPIARAEQNSTFVHEDFGFAFDTTYRGADTSMRGVLPNDQINIFTKMTIHQIFVERGSTSSNPGSWVKEIDFIFTNPRFTNLDIDDLDHENGGNFNIITASVDFDTMFMEEPKTFSVSNSAPSFASGDIPAGGVDTSAQGGGGGGSFGGSPFISDSLNLPGLGLSETTNVGGLLASPKNQSLFSISPNQAIARMPGAYVTDSGGEPGENQFLTRSSSTDFA